MALVGLNARRAEVLRAIEEIEGRLGGRSKAGSTASPLAKAKPKRNNMSAAARRRIAQAQTKRWAAYRRAKADSVKPVKKVAVKRKLSPAVKARLVANLSKARAAKDAKKTEGEAVPS